MMPGANMGGWAWAGMATVLLVGLAIVVAWVMTGRTSPPARAVPTAREQLDERLATGAIDARDYRERVEAMGTFPPGETGDPR